MFALPASVRSQTLADVFLPATNARLQAALADALLIAGASVLVAVCARISIPLPWTPVPVTGQTFAVLLIGMVLGPRRAALALLLYLLEGAAGLPVFAGGAAGVARLWGPTGGYLWSYPLAAAITGSLAVRGWDKRPHQSALAMFLGSLVVLTLGSLWLSFFVGGLAQGFARGFLPFLPGDVLKTLLAAGLFPGAWALVRKLRGA